MRSFADVDETAGHDGGRSRSPADGAPTFAAETTVRPRRYGWLREAALVYGFYLVYSTIRSIANHGDIQPQAFRNANRLVRWEQSLHIFNEWRVQRFFLPARWFIKSLNIYYGSLHFIITAALLIWVYRCRHQAYRRLRNLLGITTGLALIGYWSFPLAPPRMYSCNCFVDTLDTIGGLWSYNSKATNAVANKFAAMPSLHFGWALWCGIVFFTLSKRRAVRSLLVIYPLVTLAAIVITANHYWLDAVGGATILGVAFLIQRFVDRRFAARRDAKALSAADQPDVEARAPEIISTHPR